MNKKFRVAKSKWFARTGDRNKNLDRILQDKQDITSENQSRKAGILFILVNPVKKLFPITPDILLHNKITTKSPVTVFPLPGFGEKL
jgi:hypothetical protein